MFRLLGETSLRCKNNIPDSNGDVNQGVRAVENGEHRLVIISEERLNIDLAQRKQEAEGSLVLKP